VGVTATDLLDLEFTGRYGHVEGELDNSGGAGGDDPNRVFETYYRHLGGRATAYLWDEQWESSVGVSVTQYDRYDNNDPDPAHPAELSRSSFESELLKVDWINTLYLNEWNTLVLGAEHERELGASDFYSESAFGPFSTRFPEEQMRSNGYFVQDQIALADSFFATVGVRVDDHQEFGTETTYRIAPAYVIRETGTRVKATYGTGFKAPTLFQLFSSFGNPDLDAETSQSWDVGVEQSFWGERARVGVTYFNNEFDDLIDFVSTGAFTGTYRNVDEAWSRGWELTGQVQPCKGLTLRGSYTHQETRDREANDELLRRPRNSASGDALYTFDDGKADVGLGIVWVGDRDDMDFSTFPAERVTLDDYTLVNLNAAYRFSEHCTVFGRVENVFDEEYETVKGFGQPGRGLFGGVKLCW
jgi:vitamin B12 transporter